ncbi:hypothetical protein [Nocardia tengchongensis]|uniref:hypothetical protein n=1 Tax=Nocardia tengchongensis TaxID=2055889 RepID=UPI0036C3AB04
MASYEHREVHRIRHEWRVPGAGHGGWGAAIAEVQKAIHAAENRYQQVFGKEPSFDDWLRVWAADDEIVFWFEQEVSGRG